MNLKGTRARFKSEAFCISYTSKQDKCQLYHDRAEALALGN